ncbi:hypothetical protein GT204_06845 [Streptomyces sp. SID4919]|uniref:Lipoprotein n=1 Tax=Streptomyces uncialis TaxID=1048205 RepID=A0A1Q4V7R0_9ACTN|nr:MULTISPECIES: hypothetical protein [Streptomyces]MCX4661619.1 hypothetical protein [Streptomyces uncialis]MYY08629.1 hypothetical protein [Streptomyces sp. SID4919]OKH93855.1 hypothetical protein AB852_14170 [Streptomyces uncialis]WST72438.1 hypothetical protein OG268_36340 [Streptomyces uncialis]WTE08896.1 hypothetical protein OG924_00485 [Streptomyces uncialis]
MQISRTKNFARAAGLAAATLAAVALAVPGNAQAAPVPAYWTVDCDKFPADGDPGAHDLTALIYRTNDPGKAAKATFKAATEKLSINNWSGAMMGYKLQWANASGTAIERTWELDMGSGNSKVVDFEIPEGRKVYVSVGTPGGSTAFCNGIA